MIRINLVGVERPRTRKALIFDAGQRITAACVLILLTAALGIGWRYRAINQESAQLVSDIAAAQQETVRLRGVLAEVQRFEAQRTQLQQRVSLIEQLRRGQSVPVQLLDHVSRSLPDMLWLTNLEEKGNDVTIEGRSTTLIALSDFVGNLGNNSLLKKPIEIVNSQVEAPQGGAAAGGAELIRFTVKAQLADTAAPAAAAPSAAPAGAPPAPGAAR